jgi:hypothetical protein
MDETALRYRTDGAPVELVLVLVGVELVLLVATARRLTANRRLLDELRRCHTELASALALIDRGETTAARRIVKRWLVISTTPKPPPLRTNQSDGVRLH